MPICEWTIIATSYSVDRETNSLSIFNVLDDVQVPAEVPEPAENQAIAIGPPIAVIQLWSRAGLEEGKVHSARGRFVNPQNVNAGNWDLQIDLSQLDRVRTFSRLPFIPFSTAGVYRIFVDLLENDTWVQVASAPLNINRIKPTVVQPPPETK